MCWIGFLGLFLFSVSFFLEARFSVRLSWRQRRLTTLSRTLPVTDNALPITPCATPPPAQLSSVAAAAKAAAPSPTAVQISLIIARRLYLSIYCGPVSNGSPTNRLIQCRRFPDIARSCYNIRRRRRRHNGPAARRCQRPSLPPVRARPGRH